MDEKRSDDVLLAALIAALLGGTGDPAGYDLLRYLRRRGRLGERIDPELDMLLERALYARRSVRVEDIEDRLNNLQRRISNVSADLYDLTWLLESGGDIADARVQRAVPARMYVAESVSHDLRRRISTAVDELLRSLGLEKVEELPDEHGSWWKRFIFKTKSALTHEEVKTRLKKAEEAIEATYLDKPQAEANNQQAQGAASLIAALKDVDNGCVQVGTLLVVKATDGNGKCAVAARTLTRDELKHLEQNQAILKEPGRVLELLQAGDTTETNASDGQAPAKPPHNSADWDKGF